MADEPKPPPLPGGMPRPPLPPLPGGAARPPLGPPLPGRPGAPALPSAPAAPAVSEAALKDMEARTKDLEESKKTLEAKLAEMERRLMEEREKTILAVVRSKEESALQSKVESSIKDIQDKLRRDRREQELETARAAAEKRVLELERRLAEEREAWVGTLKNQLGQRDVEASQVEENFSRRLLEFEKRWVDEKARIESALAQKTEELEKLQQDTVVRVEQTELAWQKRLADLTSDRDGLQKELDELSRRKDEEVVQLRTAREQQEKEWLLAKSQFALIESQLKTDAAHQSQILESLKADLGTTQKELNAKAEMLNGLRVDLTQKDAALQQKIFDAASVPALQEKIRHLEESVQVAKTAGHKLEGDLAEAKRAQQAVELHAAAERDELARLRQEIQSIKAVADANLERERSVWGQDKARMKTELDRLAGEQIRQETALREEAQKRRVAEDNLGDRARTLLRLEEELRLAKQQLAQVVVEKQSLEERYREQLTKAERDRSGLEERLHEVRDDMLKQEMSLRDRIEREYKDKMAAAEAEYQRWAQDLMRSAEEKIREQAVTAQKKIEISHDEFSQDLSLLEAENRRLKEGQSSTQRSLDEMKARWDEERRLLRDSVTDAESQLRAAQVQWEARAQQREKEALAMQATQLDLRAAQSQTRLEEEKKHLSDRVRRLEQDLERLEKDKNRQIEEEKRVWMEQVRRLEVESTRQRESERAGFPQASAIPDPYGMRQRAAAPEDVGLDEEERSRGLIGGLFSWLNKPVVEVHFRKKERRRD